MSFEEVTALKGSSAENVGNAEYCFSEKLETKFSITDFSKCDQNVAFLKKLILYRSICLEKVALL